MARLLPWTAVVALALALSGLLAEDADYVHASVRDPSVPLHESSYDRVAVWGWPLPWLRDSLDRGVRGEPDPGDDPVPGALLADWLMAVPPSLALVALLDGMTRRRSRRWPTAK
jgi:hypothetical protein